MTNKEAYAAQEAFCKQVLALPTEKRNEYFAGLVEAGIVTPEECKGLMQLVGYYEMFTNPTKYKAMQDEACEMYLSTLDK